MFLSLQGLSQQQNEWMVYVPAFLVLGILFCVGLWFMIKTQRSTEKIKMDRKLREISAITTIRMGKLIDGFDVDDPYSIVCAVTENNFVFLTTDGTEVGRIANDSIDKIVCDDMANISKPTLIGRILSSSLFSPDEPEDDKHKTCFLDIEWVDGNGEQKHAIFIYAGVVSDQQANLAASLFERYRKPKSETMPAVVE